MLIDVNQKYVELLPQWKDVADLLEVDSLKTQWVETCVRPVEGLTRAMLEIYMRDGGTLGDVLEALLELECLQILEKVKPKVNKFVEARGTEKERIVLEDKESNFFSILSTLESVFGKNDPCTTIRRFSQGLCRSQFPSPPITHEILVQESAPLIGVTNDPNPGLDLKDYPVYRGSPTKQKWNNSAKTPDDNLCRILLIFAEDGVDFANQVYQDHQGFEFKDRRVEIFRLNESTLWYEVLVNPEACCMKWANEADFIMPILTPKFLREVQGGAEFEQSSLLPTSPVLNRFMYTLLRARYADSGCKNTMVRPIIPKEHNSVAQLTAVRADPLFRLVWIELDYTKLRKRLQGMLSYMADRQAEQ